MSLYEFGSDASGLRFTIDAVSDGAGGTKFTVHVITGSLNLNALYWSDGDSTGGESSSLGFTGAKSENSLNMNGSNVVWNDDGTSTTAKEVYDGGIKLSDVGLGKGDGSTFLTAGGEDYQLTVANLDLSHFSTLGVRATSTSTAEGSIKWVDDTPYDPPPPDEPVAFDGLSHGAWGTPNAGAGHWNETTYQTGNEYDDVFGVTAGGNIAGDSLLEVLNQPAQGNAEAILGKQAVAALLNSSSSGEGTLTQDYRFTTSEVIDAVKEVYDGVGFDQVQAADLQDLLEFWNTAPEHNVGPGATVPGELHSDDTTTIATTLVDATEPGNVNSGGSFEGSIFEVLNGLHPTHGWDGIIS
jgi:hypothetical protein